MTIVLIMSFTFSNSSRIPILSPAAPFSNARGEKKNTPPLTGAGLARVAALELPPWNEKHRAREHHATGPQRTLFRRSRPGVEIVVGLVRQVHWCRRCWAVRAADRRVKLLVYP